MPKVYYNNQDRQQSRIYELILGRMQINELTKSEVAAALGISKQLFGYKIRNKTLTLWELLKIGEILEITFEDLQRALA